jgi:chemoreceptor-like protein with four helix bundle sensory module
LPSLQSAQGQYGYVVRVPFDPISVRAENVRRCGRKGRVAVKFGIRAKLFAGFGVVLLLLAIVGVIGYRNTVQADDAFDALYSDQLVMTTQLSMTKRAPR